MKKAHRRIFRFFKYFFQYILLTFLTITLLLLLAYDLLIDRIYPGISVAGLNLSVLTSQQATDLVNYTLRNRVERTLTFNYQGTTFSLDLSSMSKNYSSQNLVNQAFSFGHFKPFFSKIDISPFTRLSPEIQTQIVYLAQGIDQPAVDATLKLSGDQISVTPSSDGRELDQNALKESVLNYLNLGIYPSPSLPVKKLPPSLSSANAMEFKKELEEIKFSPIKLVFQDQSFPLDLSTVLSLIDAQGPKSVLVSGVFFSQPINIKSLNWRGEELADIKLTLNPQKLSDYLKQNVSPQIDRDVKEPIFNYDGKKVTDFQPPIEGYKVNLDRTVISINQHLSSRDFSAITLAVDTVPPKNKLVNQLGIKELLGAGVSQFAHSISNRIYNIELAASRVNGTIVPPGGIFSYNDSVGEISAATGYKQGYIIKSGRTVLDDGGGVCQDSTTLFRAVLKAGLPVISRTAHAYRVGYYEQDSLPGLDATVFAPGVDFRFKNDTPASILIQAYTINDEILHVDLYGTSDGRLTTLSTPIITSQTPPPADIHQDDPSLPKGTTKQVDFPAWGANVVFNRSVTRNNQVLIHETYRSNYQPWAAMYLVGTGS